jgi:hypothetical protein
MGKVPLLKADLYPKVYPDLELGKVVLQFCNDEDGVDIEFMARYSPSQVEGLIESLKAAALVLRLPEE